MQLIIRYGTVIVIIHNEAEVNGRPIYTARRKSFYTICQICIKNLHYHHRQAWTHLKTIRLVREQA